MYCYPFDLKTKRAINNLMAQFEVKGSVEY